MAYLDWLDQLPQLSDFYLTVRAQAVAAIDQGKLWHPYFFPRQDSRSVRIADIFTLNNFRPTADRREWNARGREIPLLTPNLREVEIVPVESKFRIDEYEIQRLTEGSFGNAAIIQSVIAPAIPERTDRLVQANLRRIEVDAMAAWSGGSVTVRNPAGAGTDKVVSLGYDSARYVTPTPWTGTATTGTAWPQFIAETYNARNLIGEVSGAVMRLSTFQAIQSSAPLAAATGQVSPIGITTLEARMADQFGVEFAIHIIEDHVDIFTDGGTDTSAIKTWPSHKVAWIPADGIIGNTFYAPVARAYNLANVDTDEQIDRNGMTVVRDIANGGRDLTVECQVNAFALPNEQAVYVVDAGI